MACCVWVTAAALLLAGAGPAWSEQAEPAPFAAPIVQPGAPGQNSKPISAADALPRLRTPAEADISFMQGMIMHHSQAVEMTALMTTRSHNKNLLALGRRISISQTDEMKYMRQWLEDRGLAIPTGHDQMASMDHMKGMDHTKSMDMGTMAMMPGMLTDQQMKALALAKGRAFDRLFLTGMIQHHTGALIMVENLFAAPGAGQDNQLFDFATDVDNTQRAEIKIMQGMLASKKDTHK